MQESFVDMAEWTAFWKNWDATIKKMPDMKAEMLRKVGEDIQNEVRRTILSSGVNDAHGRVRSWQNPHVGSGLGYVAVRSDSVEVQSGGGGRKSINAGAITNFLTSGHRVRPPSGRAKRYVPRTRMARVPGARFYKTAEASTVKIALEAAEAYLREIDEELTT